MGIPFSASATAAAVQPPCRGTGQALRQQPHRVPPFSLPWRRRSVHPPSYLSPVHAPPLQQCSYLLHAQQQPPLRLPGPFRPSQPPYPAPTPCGFHLGFGLGAGPLIEPRVHFLGSTPMLKRSTLQIERTCLLRPNPCELNRCCQGTV